MDTSAILDFLYEVMYLLIVFGVFISLAVIKGKQSLINIILGLYLALLLSIEFPFYDQLSGSSPQTISIVKITIFTVFAILSAWLFARLMPRNFDEKAFEGFGMKALFALGGTVLVMAFSYNVLPITEFITPGSPIQALFAPESYFFWWLMLPLGFLFLL